MIYRMVNKKIKEIIRIVIHTKNLLKLPEAWIAKKSISIKRQTFLTSQIFFPNLPKASTSRLTIQIIVKIILNA